MNIRMPLIEAGSGYDDDFHAWALAQAAHLRAAQPSEVDWENIAEEIESLGKSLQRELQSRITLVLEHLLKFQYSLNRDPTAGWKRTLLEQRHEIADLLEQSPSLRRGIDPALDRCFTRGRKSALAGFEEFEPDRMSDYRALLPSAIPYSVDQILDEDFLPDVAER